MASIRKLNPDDPKSPWVCEYTDAAGKRRRKTPKTGLKKDADAIARKIEREMEDGTHVTLSESATISQTVALYLRHYEQKLRDGRIGPSHFARTKSACARAEEFMGKKLLSELHARDAAAFYEWLCKRKSAHPGGRPMHPRTAKEWVKEVARLEAFAVKQGFSKRPVVSEIMVDLRGINYDRIRVFSHEEAERLFATVFSRERTGYERSQVRLECMVALAGVLGMRYGEITGLTLDDVDFTRGVIHIRHSLTRWDLLKSPKTAAGRRDNPLPAELAMRLRHWISEFYVENERRLVFRTEDGGAVTQGNFWTKWVKVLKRADLLKDGESAFHFHALRHYAASTMVERGLPITDVAKLLGHSKFDMTLQVYAHPMASTARHMEMAEMLSSGLLPQRHPKPDATKTRHIDVTL